MLVDAVMQELAAISTLAGRIEGGLEYAKLVDDGKLPQGPQAAFVMSLGFDPAPPLRASTAHVQRVKETIGIVLVVQKADDPGGTKSRAAVERLVLDVIDLLAGFNPGDDFDLLSFGRGRLAGLRAGAAFYQVDFYTHSYVRRT